MNLDITNWTIFAGFQIPHNAHFADCENNRQQIIKYRLSRLKRQSRLNVQQRNALTANTNSIIEIMTDLQECKHSTMVVASMKYPPHKTHIKWGFSSVILILVVRCIVMRARKPDNQKKTFSNIYSHNKKKRRVIKVRWSTFIWSGQKCDKAWQNTSNVRLF